MLSLHAIHPDVLISGGERISLESKAEFAPPGYLSVNIFIKSSEIIDFINMDDNASQIPSSGKNLASLNLLIQDVRRGGTMRGKCSVQRIAVLGKVPCEAIASKDLLISADSSRAKARIMAAASGASGRNSQNRHGDIVRTAALQRQFY